MSRNYSVIIAGNGNINGIPFTAGGSGKGNVEDGSFNFSVDFSDVDSTSDPFVNVVSILIFATGVFGREIGDAKNLLSLAEGEFSFRQRIYGDGIVTESVGELVRSGDQEFTWTSRANGNVRFHDVTHIEPTRVLMLPAGPGRVLETIEWNVVDRGATKKFCAVREFTFARPYELANLQLRDVTVQARSAGLRVELEIQSEIRQFPSPKIF